MDRCPTSQQEAAPRFIHITNVISVTEFYTELDMK